MRERGTEAVGCVLLELPSRFPPRRLELFGVVLLHVGLQNFKSVVKGFGRQRSVGEEHGPCVVEAAVALLGLQVASAIFLPLVKFGFLGVVHTGILGILASWAVGRVG